MLPVVVFLAMAFAADSASNPASNMVIRGPNGQSMSAEDFQKAKQAHRADPENNSDPSALLGLRRNMGYDVVNGKRGPWRPKKERSASKDTDVDSEALDRVVGRLPDGRAVTLKEYIDAKNFHRANPSAPEPEELQLSGTSYTASVSYKSDDGGVFRLVKNFFQNLPFKGSAFSLPMEWRANLSRAPCQAATRSPNSSPGSAVPVGRMLGLGLGIGAVLAFRAPRRAGRKMHSRTRAVQTVNASTHPSLMLKPDDSVYQRLPTYDIATEKFYGMPASEQEEILLKLRALVTRYELEQVVGVDIKHRHFEMLPRHVLLESQRVEAKESVMRPAAMSEPMTPFSFVLMDGKWMPYEFVEEHCHSAQLGLTKVARCGGFLQELSHYLAARGLEDVFGFHVLHREHLSGEARGTLETPGRSENELLIRPYSTDLLKSLDASDNRQVMWAWSTGLSPVAGICAMSCTNICSHCGSHCKSHTK